VHQLAEIFAQNPGKEDFVRGYCNRLAALMQQLDAAAVARFIELIDAAGQEHRTIFFIANGGSAAVASHWVNDLAVGAYKEGQPGFRAYCLTDNIASVTAISNDASFQDIFAHQLRVNMNPGDLVVAMSVSGNSENVIRGVDFARAHGGATAGICGFDGGRLAGRCDVTIHIRTTPDEYGPVEDLFSVLDHLVMGYLAMQRGKPLHH